MNTYQVTPANNATKTQAHVKELNSNVAVGSFKRYGVELADLYASVNSCSTLVAHGTCPPVNDTYRKTVYIKF